MSAVGAFVVGVILLVLAAVLPQPAPLPLLEIIFGVVALAYGLWALVAPRFPRGRY